MGKRPLQAQQPAGLAVSHLRDELPQRDDHGNHGTDRERRPSEAVSTCVRLRPPQHEQEGRDDARHPHHLASPFAEAGASVETGARIEPDGVCREEPDVGPEQRAIGPHAAAVSRPPQR